MYGTGKGKRSQMIFPNKVDSGYFGSEIKGAFEIFTSDVHVILQIERNRIFNSPKDGGVKFPLVNLLSEEFL